MKQCTKCKDSKHLTDFPPNKKTTDKLGSWCKTCIKTLKKTDYQNHKSERDLKTVAWQRKNKDRVREYRIKSTFQMTNVDYAKLLIKQDHKCSICLKHQDELKKSLAIDHDHITGKIRGLLCTDCNLAIGLLRDSVENLDRAISYLDKE